MLKANREPKDYRGRLISFSSSLSFLSTLFWISSNRFNKIRAWGSNIVQVTVKLRSGNKIAGLLATQNGRYCMFFARTRTVCFIKTQSELFMMEACLNIWRKNTNQRRRKHKLNRLAFWFIGSLKKNSFSDSNVLLLLLLLLKYNSLYYDVYLLCIRLIVFIKITELFYSLLWDLKDGLQRWRKNNQWNGWRLFNFS